MTRMICFAALAAMSLSAQDAKIATPAAPIAPDVKTSSERALSENELLKLQLTQAKIELLQKKYDTEGFQKEVKPLSDEQQAIFQAACESVGVPKDKMAECRLQTGLDEHGKQAIGPDGKPVEAKVWREVAKPADSTSGAPKAK